METQQSITWTAQGKRLESDGETLSPIPITELSRSVSMSEGSFPYGIAVDAPLAVQMIRNFWEQVKKEVPDDKSWTRTVLEQSRAITFDKNVLLKILSQPKSEGIRFYLCMKNNETGVGVLSLVAVGVDEAGNDLLYDYNEDIHRAGIKNIPTTSLVAEYGWPPGFAEENDQVSMDPYVLFRYSVDI